MTTSTDKAPSESKKYRMAERGLICTTVLALACVGAAAWQPAIQASLFTAIAVAFGAIGSIVSVYCHGQAQVDKAAAGKE